MNGLVELRQRHPVHPGYPHFNEAGIRVAPTSEEVAEMKALLTSGVLVRESDLAAFRDALRKRAIAQPLERYGLADACGLEGSVYLEKRDGKTGRLTGVHYESNIITDRGLLFLMRAMASMVTFTTTPAIDTPDTNPFATMILSDSRKIESREESDNAQNPAAGNVVGSFANTARDTSTSAQSNNNKTLTMSYLLSISHAIDGIPFSSIGWAQGASAGSAGSQSRWGSRTVLGRPATIATTAKPLVDLLRSLTGSLIAPSTEKGSNVKGNTVDGPVDATLAGDLTTWWESTDIDEGSNIQYTLLANQQSVVGFHIRWPVRATGTGTISSSGTAITGVGTVATTQLRVGDTIIAAGQTRRITAIATDTGFTVDEAPSPAWAGASFQFGSAKKAPDSFSVRVSSTTGGTVSNYPGVINVVRGRHTVAGGGQFVMEFAAGDVTGIGRHFANAGEEGLTFLFDVVQTIGKIQLFNVNNDQKGVALRSATDGATNAGGTTLTSTAIAFTQVDVGRVVIAVGMPVSVIQSVAGNVATISPAWTGSLTGLSFNVQETRSVQISDVQLLQVDTTSTGTVLTTYNVLATNNELRVRAGYRSAPRGYNGSTNGAGTQFSTATAAAAQGFLTVIYGAEIPHGASLVLKDGTNTVTFQFDKGLGGITGTPITITNLFTKAQVKAAIIAAINGVVGGLLITASAGAGDLINLVNDATGAGGTQQITGTAESLLKAFGMSGGATATPGPFTTGVSSPDIGRLIKLGGDAVGTVEARITSVVDTNTVNLATSLGASLTGQTYDILDVNDFQTFTIASGAQNAPAIITALNNQFLLAMMTDRDVARLEAFTGPGWNHVHLRSRTKGQDSFIQIDSVANGSKLNTLLGYPTGGALDYGETVSFVKNANEVLTIVYQFNWNFDTLFTGSAL